jgi:hypothetical protein
MQFKVIRSYSVFHHYEKKHSYGSIATSDFGKRNLHLESAPSLSISFYEGDYHS